MLEVEGLAAGYLGERVIDGIDIEVGTGEAVAIIGSNGAGKTTLFRAIAGLLPAMDGRVVLDGEDLTRRPAHRVSRAGIAYVPAERHLFPAMSLKSNLTLGAYPRRPDAATLELVYDLFPRLKERQRQQAGTLSGGEQQMLAVARALMARPRLLMLDEPTTGLAPIIAQSAFEALEGLKNEGMTLLIAEQQVPLALSVADRGYVLENGRIRLTGTSEELDRNPEVQRAYLGVSGMRAVILDGIVLGLAFGLLGVGMTLVYGLGGVLNLAYGQIVVLAAIVISLLMEDGGRDDRWQRSWVCWRLPGVAVLLDLTLMRPVYREHGEERTLLGLLLTLGAAFVIGGLLTWRYPAGALYIYIGGNPVSSSASRWPWGVSGPPRSRSLSARRSCFLRCDDLRARRPVRDPGRGRRAAHRHQPVLRQHGRLRAERSACRGVAIRIDERAVDRERRLRAHHLRAIVTVVGGLGSVAGAFLAGVLLGVVNALSAHSHIGQHVTTIILLGAAALTILIRPRGLLGR